MQRPKTGFSALNCSREGESLPGIGSYVSLERQASLVPTEQLALDLQSQVLRAAPTPSRGAQIVFNSQFSDAITLI
eukprot:scaffold489856_cov17-Prasinocladus_malaysianus.AAC.1